MILNSSLNKWLTNPVSRCNVRNRYIASYFTMIWKSSVWYMPFNIITCWYYSMVLKWFGMDSWSVSWLYLDILLAALRKTTKIAGQNIRFREDILTDILTCQKPYLLSQFKWSYVNRECGLFTYSVSARTWDTREIYRKVKFTVVHMTFSLWQRNWFLISQYIHLIHSITQWNVECLGRRSK
jgi:hypothetical protein